MRWAELKEQSVFLSSQFKYGQITLQQCREEKAASVLNASMSKLTVSLAGLLFSLRISSTNFSTSHGYAQYVAVFH